MAQTQFHISDLVTVITGRLVAFGGIQSVYVILDHINGGDVMTHEIPSGMRRARVALLEQHPWLGEIDPAELGLSAIDDDSPLGPVEQEAVCAEWVRSLQDRYGAYHSVGTAKAVS